MSHNVNNDDRIVIRKFDHKLIYKDITIRQSMSGILDTFIVDSLRFLPGVGAAILSIRNWLVLRRGADIFPLPVVNYGLWAIKTGDKSNKSLILPVLFNNDGVKNGLVIGVDVSFKHGDEYIPIQIRRQIKLNDYSEQEVGNMNLAEFRNKYLSSINPTYPIQVNAHEGNRVLFEAFDGENVIPIGKETTCRITTRQHNGQSNSIEFPFHITQEQFEKTVNNLSWYSLR